MSIKRYKIKQDPVTNVWYVLHKEMDQNSRWRWVIRHTAQTAEEASAVKNQLEKRPAHDQHY